ncbi:nucleotidyltransferase family protein [Spirosoma areae]
MSIATLLLAAGSSSRLGGEPKQLLTQQGTTLIRHTTNLALSLKAGPVIVVVGANRERIQPELAALPVHVVVNPDWQEGLASSLRAGLSLLTDDLVEAFLILLTDQPHITADLLGQLIATRQQTGRGIVACRYGESGHLGVPALFDRRYKTDFLALSGDVGARKLIQQHSTDCAAVLFPLAAIDLDTPQDVKKWQGAGST